MTPVEMFGRSAFPKIGAPACYGLTLAPHSFLWFSLVQDPAQFGRVRQAPKEGAESGAPAPALAIAGSWRSCLEGKGRRDLESLLLDVLPARRWFAGKARTLRGVEIQETIPFSADTVLALLRVDYAEAEAEIYALPLAFAPDADPERLERLRAAGLPQVARLESDYARGDRPALRPVRRSGDLAPAARGWSRRAGVSAASATSWPPPPRRCSPRSAARGTWSPCRSRPSRATPRSASATG